MTHNKDRVDINNQWFTEGDVDDTIDCVRAFRGDVR